jgi:hypothetical protein
MMTNSILWVMALSATALAADAGHENLHAWYQDGTCLEFFSESTGATMPSSTSGSVIVDNTNIVHRVVKDRQGQILFSYDVVARRAHGIRDTFVLQIRPAGAYTTGLRTVAAVRDFPAVKLGEAVRVDILQNPATGEKIYDVLRPSDDPPPPPISTATGDEFVLSAMEIAIHGEKFQWPTGATMTAAAARIYVPGHGAYFLSIAEAPGFREAAHANQEKLTFQLDNERVEITLQKNVLRKSANRMVWVKHDPGFVPSDAKSVEVMTADKVEWLMPKKR